MYRIKHKAFDKGRAKKVVLGGEHQLGGGSRTGPKLLVKNRLIDRLSN